MYLEKLNKARQALSAAKSLDEILSIRNTAVAALAWIEAAKMGPEMVNDAQEIKIRAERKAGESLTKMPKAKNQHSEDSCRSHDVTSNPTLNELGIGKMQSSSGINAQNVIILPALRETKVIDADKREFEVIK